MLIGNLTRDPELRYTPTGAAVCTIGLATNRSWTTESGEKKEETEFHRVVAWNKLAELCSQLLTKGRKIYVEGRLRTNTWQGQDGTQRSTTEVVIEDMIILDSRRNGTGPDTDIPEVPASPKDVPTTVKVASGKSKTADTVETNKTSDEGEVTKTKNEESDQNGTDENVNPDDIPF